MIGDGVIGYRNSIVCAAIAVDEHLSSPNPSNHMYQTYFHNTTPSQLTVDHVMAQKYKREDRLLQKKMVDIYQVLFGFRTIQTSEKEKGEAPTYLPVFLDTLVNRAYMCLRV